MIESDKDLRFVLKEFPIFGEDSEYAARAAIAAIKQGKYWDLHMAMFQHEGKLAKDSVDEIAAGLGLNMEQLKKDMDDPATAGNSGAQPQPRRVSCHQWYASLHYR